MKRFNGAIVFLCKLIKSTFLVGHEQWHGYFQTSILFEIYCSYGNSSIPHAGIRNVRDEPLFS